MSKINQWKILASLSFIAGLASAIPTTGLSQFDIQQVRLGQSTSITTGVVCRSEELIRTVHGSALSAARRPTPTPFNGLPEGCIWVRGTFTPGATVSGLQDVSPLQPNLSENGSHECEVRDQTNSIRRERCSFSRSAIKFFRGSVVVGGRTFSDVHFYLGASNLSDQYAARQQRRPDSIAGAGRPAARPVNFGDDEESRPQRRPNSDGDFLEEKEILIGI